jgi:hypothetical protein
MAITGGKSGKQVYDSGSISASNTSDTFEIPDRCLGYFMQMSLGGTLAGALKIQAASVVGLPAAGDWIDLADTVSTGLTAGSFGFNIAQPFYTHVQAVFTRTGGTGNFIVTHNAVRGV